LFVRLYNSSIEVSEVVSEVWYIWAYDPIYFI